MVRLFICLPFFVEAVQQGSSQNYWNAQEIEQSIAFGWRISSGPRADIREDKPKDGGKNRRQGTHHRDQIGGRIESHQRRKDV